MEYRPARWLPTPHVMTIVGALHRPWAWPRTVRERGGLPDGAFLDVEGRGADRLGAVGGVDIIGLLIAL